MTRALDDLMWMRKVLAEGRAAAIRTRAGLTQRELGDELGCSPAAVSTWETGYRRPSGMRARRYAQLLKMMHTANELGIDVAAAGRRSHEGRLD